MKAYAATEKPVCANGIATLVKAYAAFNGNEYQVDGMAEVAPVRALVSFALDPRAAFAEYHCNHDPRTASDVMLDSGAFSVWTKGDVVDLDAYLRWIEKVRSLIGEVQAINLDVIPGDPAGGRVPTVAERDKAVAESMRNADRMRAEGVKVMEVFHLHEPISIFDQLVERRQPGEVLALGGLAGKGSSKAKRLFCSSVFHRIRELAGGWQGILRLHGLGISPDAPLCSRYPWWSVDSSSWSIFHRYGAEVRRGGRLQKRATEANREGTRSLTSLKSASDLYYIRTLKRWRRIEEDFSRMWEGRGVTYLEEVSV